MYILSTIILKRASSKATLIFAIKKTHIFQPTLTVGKEKKKVTTQLKLYYTPEVMGK